MRLPKSQHLLKKFRVSPKKLNKKLPFKVYLVGQAHALMIFSTAVSISQKVSKIKQQSQHSHEKMRPK